ncbi:MAG TPA: metallophosphoesterase [Thermomicrobiales bacterium]|nr:metallophosphoesterase [Thermomicrobiales bacterium]
MRNARVTVSRPATRGPYAADRRIAHGEDVWDRTPPPYDIVGDVHGCIDELRDLLDLLGYQPDGDGVCHPEGRTLIFLGDLNDRGPSSIGVWKLALASIRQGAARYVPGNHDSKFVRYLMGREVQLTHGLAATVMEFLDLPERERRLLGHEIAETLANTPPYRILHGRRLVVAHAGLEEWMIGKVTTTVSAFARFGERTGDVTEHGFPIRRDWAADYNGKALIVYGHTPVHEPEFRNNTINIDQGCVFGGALTALRYPERELVSVPARRVYVEPSMAARR